MHGLNMYNNGENCIIGVHNTFYWFERHEYLVIRRHVIDVIDKSTF